MPRRTELKPDWPRAEGQSFAQGVRVGDTIYVSGQTSVDTGGNVLHTGDMKAQSQQTFRNIAAVLAEAGSTMADVVKITCYVTDIGLYSGYAEARAEAFPKNPPASATVSTPALVHPDMLVEVDAVAVVGSGA